MSRSNDKSTALTEIRTVHSRALSALDRIESEHGGDSFKDPDYPHAIDREPGTSYGDWHAGYVASAFEMADPDHDDMVAALNDVVDLLARWEGKRSRRSRR